MSEPPPPAPPTRDWRPAALGAGLGLLLVVVYWRALGGDFLWDDDTHVYGNPVIIGPLGLKEIWTTTAANYFPLVLTNFWLQHALWGLNPLGYHLVTLAFHLGAALLLGRLLVQLEVPGAWLGAALWALHPVQVESVAWICELKNTQSAVFFLLAISLFMRWAARRSPSMATAGRRHAWRLYALALGCAVAALLSKPSTVMLPVALALVWWWQRRRLTWREAVWLAPFFALSALMSGWTIWEQKFHSGAVGVAWSQTWLERCLIAGRAVWFYLGKLVWPDQLTFIYPRWRPDAAHWLDYAPLLLAVTGLGWLAWHRARLRAGWFAGSFFLALLFPVLGFFDLYFFRYSFVGDHFQYLASIGPLVLLAAGLTVWCPRAVPLVGGAAVVALAALSAVQCGDYRNNETLWRATLARNPAATMAWVNLGAILQQAGRHDQATRHFQHALRLDPTDPEAHNYLGCEHLLGGRQNEGIAELQQAVALRPAFPEAHANLGVALLQAGRTDESLPSFANALRAWPESPEVHYNLGKALCTLGRFSEALPHFETVLRHKPDFPNLRDRLGLALVDAGRPAEALPHFEVVLRARPDDPAAQCNLAHALRLLGRLPEALAHGADAVRLDPNRAEAHDEFGLALAAAGQTDEAIAHFERAIQLQPGLASVHNNLGATLANVGRMTEALARLDTAVRLDPAFAAAHLNRGGALAALGRLADACDAFTRVVQLQPESAKAHTYLAQLLHALGRETDARLHATTARQLQATAGDKR